MPERRPDVEERVVEKVKDETAGKRREITVWRCKVCGYLCARPSPPETCPICKVGKERFEPFEFP